jgi:hypothetical protein
VIESACIFFCLFPIVVIGLSVVMLIALMIVDMLITCIRA